MDSCATAMRKRRLTATGLIDVADPEFRPDIHKAAKAIKTAHEHHFGTPIRDEEFPTWAGRKACADLPEIGNPELWIRDVLPLLWGVSVPGYLLH